jgi:hypothetical protein
MAEHPLFGDSYLKRRGYLEDAERESIAVVYPVTTTPGGAARQVMGVRLNREHPVVAVALSLGRGTDEPGSDDPATEP